MGGDVFVVQRHFDSCRKGPACNLLGEMDAYQSLATYTGLEQVYKETQEGQPMPISVFTVWDMHTQIAVVIHIPVK